MEQKSGKIIRVLIADDSPIIAKVISSVLTSDPQIQVVGIACNGKEAVDMTADLRPDIITMDIHMPIMDGYEATKQIMAYHPTPILIASAAVKADGVDKMFRAISYGALDLIDISDLAVKDDRVCGENLVENIKLLSRIKVVHHLLAKLEGRKEEPVIVPEIHQRHLSEKILAIAASTGGPNAIFTILKKLPQDFPYGIVIVQHITSGFLEQFVSWLRTECRIKIKIAEEGEAIHPGVAYLAPCDLQMKVAEGGILRLLNDPLYDGHKPSGSVLFESVAKVYKDNVVGVILTGMGKDGASGLKKVKASGGKTIAQDEDSCIVFGMPKAAIDIGAVDRVCALNDIAQEIVVMLKEKI
ncbi:MAG: chemotaxis response regulator protein-glutamate methylesterase [Candidatus Omnitrophica bacterium]|nr:chemotaxis response regulator protein-glutamate methylesterase [Candidatus Omnitrophota bacterium]